jgi:DNA topoisomerase-1
MAHNLLIVESPAKAGTIGKYLGPDFQVIASMGHIRDLPASKLGVDVDKDFEPSYVIPTKARKAFTALKNALKDKTTVYLATDLDREGEAIAWHISQALELDKNPKLQVYRITFDEITKPAILAAVNSPRSLNIDLVDAQQARRVLDRLVGYTLSPVLWKKLYKGLSAGRVQSVALRLVVDRERERQAFNPQEYWSIKAELSAKASTPFTASLVEHAGRKIEQLTLSTEEEVKAIVALLEKESYSVADVQKKPARRRPSAPYTTSTLQQDAVNRLSLSSKRTMQIAQKLYEAGTITYMRTDSVSLASSAVDSIRDYLSGRYGNVIPAKPNVYVSKAKGAQEAHEAIRPTDPAATPESLGLEPAAQKLYELIWKRTLASQMNDAELEQTAVTVKAGISTLRATGQRIVKPGFLEVWGIEDKEENILPELSAGQDLNLKKLLPEQHFTEPPPRFSEATLIKALEEQGIGRPSTYAPTIDTLMQRNYVKVDQRRLAPEEVGFLVTDMLKDHFASIVDLGFTADMEERLDGIADGESTYATVLGDFWTPFHAQVLEESDKIVKVDTTEATDEVCPTCGKPMIIKMGRFGKFMACSGFPECKTTMPVPDPNALVCPICGKPLSQRRAKRGIFYGCSGYPACTFALWKKEQMLAKITELEGAGTEVPFKEQALASLKIGEPTAEVA